MLENADYAGEILEEANIKRLALIEDEKALVKVRVKPDAKKLGPRAGKHLKAIALALEQAGGPGTLEIDGLPFEIAAEELVVSYEGPANLKCSGEQGTFMALDTALTPELIEEGLARDFNRLVQDQRKVMNLEISDRIAVSYSVPPRIAQAIRAHEAYLRNELLAERLEPGGAGEGTRLVLNGEEIYVLLVAAAQPGTT